MMLGQRGARWVLVLGRARAGLGPAVRRRVWVLVLLVLVLVLGRWGAVCGM